jgi:hypothetical protein
MCANFDFDSGDSDGDYENDPNLKMEPPVKIRGVIDSIFVANSDYGQSFGINFKNAYLVHGIAGVQFKGDDGNPAKPQEGGERNESAVKVLSWASEQTQKVLSEDSPEEILEEPYLQRNYVGNNYFYDVDAARVEGSEEDDYDSTPEEEVELGDFVMYFGSTENGPKSKSKTISKIITAQAGNVVTDENSKNDWLDENAVLREDMVDREVVIAMTQKESDESGRTFHHPYILDGKTNAPIFADNTVSAAEDSESDNEDDRNDADEEDEEEEDPSDSGVPDDVQSFYDTCSELSLENETAVAGLLEEMLEDGDIDEDQVEEVGGEDAVIENVVA